MVWLLCPLSRRGQDILVSILYNFECWILNSANPLTGASSSVVPLRALLKHGFDLSIPSTTKPSGAADRVPLKSQLLNSAPSGLIEQAFMDAYFLNYHTSYAFVHEATFRAQFHEQIPRPHGLSWHILLNTILALGAWSIGDDNSDLDITFYQEARGHLQQVSVFETGNLTLVQALLLMSNYAQKRNKPNTGWNFLGLAVRMAMSLGLHKEFPGWRISLLQREIRRRLWWGVFIFDSGAAKTFGRPILLPEDRVMDAKYVLNIHDEALTSTTTTLPQESDGPTLYSGIIAQTKFHLLTNSVYQRLISSPSLTPEETLGLQKPMDEWYNGLPDYLKQTVTTPEPDSLALVRRRLMWRDWNLRTLIYRPILLRWAARRWTPGSQPVEHEDPLESDCRMLCLRNARLTIASISEYMDNYICTRLGAWYMLYVPQFTPNSTFHFANVSRYFLFQAGLIPIIFLMTDPTSTHAPGWLQDIETTKTLLSHPSLSNNRLATRCLAVVNKLCSPVYYYPTTTTTGPNTTAAATTTTVKHEGQEGVRGAGDAAAFAGAGVAAGGGGGGVGAGGAPGEPPILMQFPDQLFSDPSFGGMFPDVDQELNLGGMDFSEWLNFTP